MVTKQEKKRQIIELKPFNYQYVELSIRGITPLLQEKDDGWCAEHYDKKKGKKRVEKDDRLEEEKVEGKIHYTKDGNVGFPSSGFSTGMRKVAYGESEDANRASMNVKEAVRFSEPIIPINFKSKEIAQHIGKIMGKTPRKILRPQFNNWSCILKINYDADIISGEQLINLINKAGRRRGLGGFRPEKSGEYGQYEVITKGKGGLK